MKAEQRRWSEVRRVLFYEKAALLESDRFNRKTVQKFQVLSTVLWFLRSTAMGRAKGATTSQLTSHCASKLADVPPATVRKWLGRFLEEERLIQLGNGRWKAKTDSVGVTQ